MIGTTGMNSTISTMNRAENGTGRDTGSGTSIEAGLELDLKGDQVPLHDTPSYPFAYETLADDDKVDI